MSDEMMLAIAQMPYEMAMHDELSRRQFYENTQRLVAALEAAREDACVSLVADIRFACGDNGKRMQPELVEYIRELAEDAERYRWLRNGESNDVAVVRGLGSIDYGMDAVVYKYSEELDGDDLDAAIDEAMAKEVSND